MSSSTHRPRLARTTDRDLRGKVVAITGAGRGIGLATAGRFADAGARVVIGDLDDDVAAKAAAQVGGGAEGFVVDVADRGSFAAFLARAEALGPVEVLVNNAGIMPLSPLVEQSEESIDKILDVNLRAVITGTQLAARTMLERTADRFGFDVDCRIGVRVVQCAHPRQKPIRGDGAGPRADQGWWYSRS